MKSIFSYKRPIFFSLVLVGLSLVCILAGCEIENRLLNTEKTFGSATEDISTLVFPTSTALPTKTSTRESSNTIILWLPPQFDPADGSPAGELLDQRLSDFMAANPGILVDVRIKPAGGQGGLLDTLEITKSVAPANTPALILLPRQDFETAAISGLIYPIDGLSSAYESPEWFPFTSELTQVEGDQFGFPFAADMLVLAYKPASVEVPAAAWRDLSMGEEVLAFPAADLNALIPLAIYQSFGGEFWNEEGKPELDADVLQNAYEVLQNGAYFGAFPYWLTEFSSFTETWDTYSQDRADMTTAWISEALRRPVPDTTFTNLPSNTDSPFTYTTGWLLCISNPSSEDTDASLKLVEFLMETDFQSKWSEAVGFIPVNKTALSGWNDTALASTLIAIAETGILLPANEVLFRTGIIFEESTNDLLNQRVNAIQAVEQAVQKIQPQD